VLLSREKKLQFKKELLELGSQAEHTKNIQTFFLKKSFPVDPRHNIKIDRTKLSHYFTKHIEKHL
jgi:hypothetical protein